MTELPGDSAADFTEFVVRRYGALLGTAYGLTRDRGQAEDLVQTSLAKCWGNWDAIRAEDPLAYVRKVMVNTYRAWWRVKKGKQEYPTEHLPIRPALVDHYARIERDEVLVAALGRLPGRMRMVVVLRYLGELSEAETAEAVGCAVGTIKSQTSRALARLRVDPTLHEYRCSA
ncbi:RNA polymerase, sigma-24 subunit, ECF subfamily [Kribbella flavida DSM 17836]|uniref:RNA polymerase, sigma-24 subunit, ECF subfamily n=1 Tax=Kribbella flavida (strain DSM 17836 / JCM 10339 / NBRC 14399) TaxID=479435 RepID=D2PXQ2_KRIFD|nr:SigE family RNA polymerase sigma factor [Kribbella flavida]ADB31694.1 RNA polymerase, sigma-24 subunit, ECF subfamily [Kribbella flavida DSM 17836]